MAQQLPLFEKYPDFVHAFSTRDEGNMSFKYGGSEDVSGARSTFLKTLGIPADRCVLMGPVHGADIHHVGSADSGNALESRGSHECDALITNEKDIYLMLMTADCLPIVYLDPEKGVVGLAHCGWKSVAQNLATKMVMEMESVYGCNPKNIIVGIGPGIHKESFVHSVPEQQELPEWQHFLSDMPDGRTAIDIVGYTMFQLITTGILSGNIQASPTDTVKDETMFSHYRAAKTGEQEGRFCTVAGLRTVI